MEHRLRADAAGIYTHAIQAALPDAAVKNCLAGLTFPEGRIILIAVGKAAWTMANAAREQLGSRICRGLVLTKNQRKLKLLYIDKEGFFPVS